MPTWPIAALSLVAGFAVADITGVRPLGGIVLAAAAAWCFVRWRAQAGTARAVALVAFYLVAFVVSHVIADPLGTWGAVAAVAAAVGAASWVLADAPSVRR
jgi:thiol:disulfide interchange protein